MLELKVKPEQIDGITPYLYDVWYCGNKKVLKYIEYDLRPKKIIDNINYSSGLKILDIGCDWGYLLMWIQHQFHDAICYGIDINSKSIEFGNKLSKYNGYNIHLEYGNANKLRYENNFFDYLVSSETFEHFFPSERINILKECYRILKPGGYFLMTTPNKWGVAEIVKQFLGKYNWIRKLIPMLPHPGEKEGWVVGDSPKGDRMTNIAESIKSLRGKAEEAGFTVIDQNAFIFIPEITPDGLFNFFRILGDVLERLKIFNFLATTQFVKLKKP